MLLPILGTPVSATGQPIRTGRFRGSASRGYR